MNRLEALQRLQERINIARTKEGYGERTISTYRTIILKLIDDLNGLPDDIDIAYDYVLSKYNKPKTINTIRYALQWFYQQKLPYKKVPEERRDPEVLSVDEVYCILNTVLDNGDYYYAAMVAFMYFAAMRVGEIAKLRVGDVDPENTKTVTVYAEKSDDKYIVPLEDIAWKYILPYYKKVAKVKRRDDLLFSVNDKFPGDNLIIHHLNRYAKACNIEIHITPHTFRRTRATYMIAKGVPDSVVRTMLRHSSAQAILAYTRVSPEVLRKFVSEIDK